MLCVIDESNEHNISVWDWQKGEKGLRLAENKVSAEFYNWFFLQAKEIMINWPFIMLQ